MTRQDNLNRYACGELPCAPVGAFHSFKHLRILVDFSEIFCRLLRASYLWGARHPLEPPVEDQIAALEAKLRLLRQATGVRVILPELHDAATGRQVGTPGSGAPLLGVPLKRLAEGFQYNYKTAHRNPDAEPFQGALQPVKRSLEILDEFFHKPELVRAWLNTPRPDLDGATALETILAHHAEAVRTVLENALSGVPV